ncbi:IgGFc-binding protein-like isoform X3 [Pseudopipra pipra]|uniref:IgGFc-binding protein-like isoform X3 n=1 Tax=Pseudopipra pipra TaxID=415032 RepID=UPI003139983E
MGTLWHFQYTLILLCISVLNTTGIKQRPTGGLRTWDPETAYLTRCDFNNNSRPFCDWTQPCSINQGVWIRTKHDTPTDGTGPDGDYPDGKGYFIYQEASNLIPFDINRLESPETVVSEKICIDFWYYMFGSEEMNELRVLIQDGTQESVIWHRKGNQSSFWNYGAITHTFPTQRKIKVIFEAVRGLTEYGDTALDNVRVRDGSCEAGPTPVPPTPTPTEPTPPPVTEAICSIHGDPHYHTFDKQLHNFMGTCTYTLSKLCESNSSLPYFNVEAANEHRGSNTRVSYVRYVDVDVADQRIRLGQGGVVTVNGVAEILPCSPSAGVQVLSSGFYTMVMTDFGLRVKFDGVHRVEVTLPSTFGQKVCGMCGNYNGMAADDFLNPEGMLEPDSTSLGNSWEVSKNSSCSAGSLPTPACNDTDKQVIASSRFCGLLIDTSGPFQICHAVLSPSSYFETCSYDLCELGLDRETLCKSLQSYADACQALGVQIPVWRNTTFCPITCPANSHYEPCAAACPATCFDPMAPVTCSLPCVEGCVCDSGYLLYNDRCVPSQQCGCWHNGQHYPVGSEFWTDNSCSSKCTCPARGSKVQCFEASCPAGQYCGVQGGKPVCLEHSYGICHVHGDPHYNTFDKVTHNFMGNCTYTLAKVCSNTTSLPYFNVEAKNEHRGNSRVSYVREVLVEVYGQRIAILKQEKSQVLVNGVRQTLPVRAAGGAITVSKSGRYVVLETDFSLTVSYDTDHSVEVKVPTTYFNLTCGMCGNFNNRRDDEYMMPNGQQAADSNALGESWQVPDSDPSCGVPLPSPPCSAEEEELYKSDRFCGILTSTPSSFETCHSVINPQSYFDTCLYDLCALNGGQEFLCAALEAYADACQAAGVTLLPWRNATFCPVACPPNSHYNPCTSACPATCTDPLASKNCSKPCVEGCECNNGFVISGGQCVSMSNCGCLQNDKYYEKGESFWQPDCVGQCVCAGNGTVVCSSDTCEISKVCKVQNGLLGCYPLNPSTCHIFGDPHYITFDGRLYHFQGDCNYTVVERCTNSSEKFSVTTRNEHRGNPNWTALNSVSVTLENLHIVLKKNRETYVDGVQVKLPVDLNHGARVAIKGHYVVVDTSLGIQVKFDGDQELFILVDESLKGQLCGLCGTFNDNQLDDFLNPDKVLEQDPNKFGDSWIVKDDNRTCNAVSVVPPACDTVKEKEYEELCKIVLQNSGPFQACHWHIPPQLYFESCVYDLCATEGDSDQFCKILEAYAAACELGGVNLGEWRKDTICDMTPTTPGTTITTPSEETPTSTPTSTPMPGTETCVVEGDPHYHTFDKQLHSFMGTCTYTLSKLCESNSSLPYFNVEAANEHRGSNTRVSYVRYVDVDVADQRIRLGQGGVVTVNGVAEILPCSPSAGVQVLSSGFYTMVMTDFGLRVKFDGVHRVEVTLPSTFGQKVCGMCGNYNGMAADDFLNPEGMLEPDSTSLGNSWEVSKNSSCSAGLLPTPACNDTDKQVIASSRFCGLLIDTSGPFQICHAVLSPSSYFETCSYDLCELGLDWETLCKSLQSYADACQALGVQIPVWRNTTFCPITCPANSHYEPCAAACPATCFDPMAPVTCSLPCVEGCVCDSGYLLYDDRCVPSQQCGCWHNGQHYPVGSEFWTDNSCSSKCTCPARGSKVQCFEASCPAGQYCGVQGGKPVCLEHSYGICHVHGDPHYNTFDKVTHNFMGNCTYTLAKVCSNTTSLPYFNVEAKNEHRGNSRVSYVREVLVEVYGQRIAILKQEKSQVLVNGVRQTLPVRAAGGAITVSKSGRYVVLETDFSLTVSYDTDHSVEVKVPTTYFNLTCGMCGNFNNRRDDEYMMPNGQQAADSNALGESWQVPDSDPSCGVPLPSPPCSPEEEELYKSDRFCGILTSTPSSFETCHSVINPQSYFDTCLYDLCALNGGQEFLCAALEAYADACQAAGVTLLPWRNATFCPLKCPSNSSYDPCMTGCPATCVDRQAPQNCSKPCVEGCACTSGFLLSGDTCVPEAQCGCLFEDNYYSEGEYFVNENCTRRCQCEANGQMVCSALSCGEEEVCKIQNGQRGCYPASTALCHIYGDPHYSTFDGKLHHFQGSCNYTVVTGCDNSSIGFSVTTRNEHRGSQSWTALNSVALSLEGLHVALRERKAVYVNGALVSLPASPAPGVTISLSGSYVHVSTKLGLQLQFNGDHELLVKVSEKHKGKLCGLCGTYTGSQQDDFMRPDGVVVPDFNDFGASWMVPDDEWLCDPTISPPVSCSPAEEEAANKQCSILTHLGGPFQPCHAVLPPQTYFESCVYDQCATGSSTEQLCNDLGAYATACVEAGVALGDWSAGTVCAPTPSPPLPDTTTRPPHTTTSPAPGTSTAPPTDCNFTCTFDKDFCGWVQADYSSIDWIRNKGPTPTPNTGPSSDHTTGDGYYIYLQGTDDALSGFVAVLVGPVCSWEGTHCFRFWYHMYGNSEMALRVYVAKDSEQVEVWNQEGNHGDMWHLGEVTVHITGNTQILLEGQWGEDARSNVALDDLSIEKGSCAATPTIPQPGTTTQTTARPPTAPPGTTSGPLPPTSSTPLPNITTQTTARPPTAPPGTTSGPLPPTSSTPLPNITTQTTARPPTAPPGTTSAPTPSPPLPDTTTRPPHTTTSPAPGTSTAPPTDCNFTCTFDKDFCGWVQADYSSIDWIRNRGPTPTPNTGPSSDHTTGDGYYIYLQGTDDALSGFVAVLVGPVCSWEGTHCFRFWYHMYGNSEMALRVYVAKDSEQVEVWNQEGNHGDMWHLGEVTVHITGNTQILLEGQWGEDARSNVALDDLSIEKGSCAGASTATPTIPQPGTTTQTTARPPTAPPGTTSGPLPPTSSTPLPNITTQTTPRPPTAPPGTTSGPLPPTSSTPLPNITTQTTARPPTAPPGTTSGPLPPTSSTPLPNITTQTTPRPPTAPPGTTSGPLPPTGSTPLPNITTQTTPRPPTAPPGTTSGPLPPTSSTPLPNITTQTTARPPTAPPGTTSAPTPSPPLPDTTTRPPHTTTSPAPGTSTAPPTDCNFTCTFDKDFCGWVQADYSSIDWIRNRGPTPTPNTGPSSDHTTGDGYYIYLQGTDDALSGFVAVLVGPVCSWEGTHCFRFWYHMYGNSEMALRVYVAKDSEQVEVWNQEGNHGDMWHLGEVTVHITGNTQILLEGQWGEDARSNVALDDLSIEKGSCAGASTATPTIPQPGTTTQTTARPPTAPPGTTSGPLPPTSSTPLPNITTQTTPRPPTAPPGTTSAPTPSPPLPDTTTRPPHTTTSPAPGTSTAPPTDCNFTCTFDKDFCGWVQADYSSIDWIRNRGPTPTPNTGPSSDHTTGDGYYIYLQETDDALSGFVAVLVGPVCNWEGTHCFRFWYHMYGNSEMALRVYVAKDSEQVEVWNQEGNHGDMWHLGEVTVHITGNTQILLEGQWGEDARSNVALDDLSIEKGSCAGASTATPTIPQPGTTTQTTARPPTAPPGTTSGPLPPTSSTPLPNITTQTTPRPPTAPPGTTSGPLPPTSSTPLPNITTQTTPRPPTAPPGTTSGPLPPTGSTPLPNITTQTTARPPTAPPGTTSETCVVEGDPHYHTFDKQLHSFMGTCTYTLSKLCESNSSLPYFNVEAANEHRGSNTRVSYVRYVDVDVADQRIRLGQGGVVTVNGVAEILPCSPSAGVQVLSSGFYTMVMTDFGLRVKFDGVHRVEVTLPSTFGQKVCGMCGNYNGMAADDFLNPEGMLEPDSTSLGNSWEVSKNSSCSAGLLPTPACNDTDKQVIASSHFCGLLIDTSGPFQICHAVLSPSSYFETCSYDLCELGLDRETLCKSLQSYADACQALGVQIPVWRNTTFCPITCPANSHYEPCAAACPATCFDPMAPVTCSLPCVEGCVCDSGYLLYDDRCVPSQQCGCWHNGQHYPVGSEFWTDNSCSSKCTCPARGSKVQCFEASCPVGQYCGVQGGKPVCLEHSYGICHVHGDPHYNTFDKVTHNFMGNCTYTLAKVCSNTTSLPYFNVEAKNEHRGNSRVSYVREVLVEVYGQRIAILKQEKSQVLVNGVRQTLPVRAAGGAITVSKSGRYVVLETDFSLTVSYDTDHSVEVKVPTTYFSLTCGMCGNFNNRRDDEYMMPNGQQAADSNALGESWQVPDSDPSCGVPVPSPPCSAEEEELYKSDRFCGILTSTPSSFETCHSVINPQSYFDTCLYDLCALNGGQEFLCAALEAYADACQAAGVTLLPWRNATFCPLKCPSNSSYDPCMTGCPATCVDRQAPQNCSKPCVEGCACTSGFLLSGDTCVPEAQCGCLFEDNYYSEGEYFVNENCTRRCQCEANGQMVCSALSCGEEEVCKIQNGQRGCYPASTALCHIYGDPHYSTFDGKLHHFQGSCNYTVVTGCDNSSIGFSVTTRNEHRGSQSWTALNSVALSLEGLHVALRERKAVYVNGALVSLPASPAPGVTISLSGSYVHVSTKLGLQLQFNGDHELLVKVSEKHKGKLCGLCGTYTGSQQDDFMRPDGVVVPDFNDFGASWMVPDDEWPCDPAISPPVSCSPAEEEAANKQCSILTHLGGPFQPCHAVLPPQTYFESCVYDQCATGSSTEQLCNDLGAYATACVEAGVALGDWSAGTVCAPTPSPPLPDTTTRPPHTTTSPAPGTSTGPSTPTPTIPLPGTTTQPAHTTSSTTPIPSSDRASCSASGDPHYNTFDHRVHNFMGNCTYTLSKVCNVSEKLPYFDVSTTNEHRGANTKVSYVKSVQVEVYDNQISLLKNKKVNVNGRRMNLPVFIEKKISIQSSGGYVLLETDFGLWVRYDGNHYAEVSVPSNYSHLLCGLCGNYNGDPNDDNIKPNGDIASGSTDLGESWLVPENNTICSSGGTEEQCDPVLESEAKKNTACGMITDPTGIFKDCHTKVPPENLFENCVYDMCFTGGQAISLCYGLQAYAESCINAGICIEWRNATLCPMSCPGGSIYKSCGTRCPSTCLNISAADSCSSLPVEGCFCKEGYVLSGDKCVPESSCGCVDEKNQYHQLDESWFTHYPCTERCTCKANNTIECTSWECGVQEECSIQDGVLGCHSNGQATCQVVGDPHYFTFDGMKYTFMGTCTYTLVEVVNTSTNVIPITILGKNEDRGLRGATYLKEVYIDVHGVRITLQKNQGILLNNERVYTPVENRLQGVSIGNVGRFIVVETDFGVIVKYDGNHHLEITLPQSYFSQVHGMCGNLNDNREDDLSLPNGTVVSATQFGNSWKVEEDSDKGCLPDLREDDNPPCTAENKQVIESQCNVLKSDKFKVCHNLVNPEDFVDICIYDMCQYDGMKSALCDIVQAYVETCKNHGITIKWRNNTFCPLPCPSRSHYKDCVSACPSTCNDIFASSLCDKTEECTEGCECDDNYVLSNGNCVPLSSCGCRDDDNNYYSAGETWITPHCARRCQCQKNGVISCNSYSCDSRETCVIQNGKNKCHPTGFGRCQILGDPHYTTFDGLVHHFQGKYTYILAQTIPDLPDTLTPFSIEGINSPLLLFRHITYLKEILINVYNHTVRFRQNKQVLLDGVRVRPPLRPHEGIHIYQRITRIYLETDFGLYVSFDGNQNADIKLANTYGSRVEGLCGDFDGRYRNDFTNPDGVWVKNVNVFGESWKVPLKRSSRFRRDVNSGNESMEEPDPGLFQGCNENQLEQQNATSRCQILTDLNGPFAKCHSTVLPDFYFTSCLFDMCVEGDEVTTLCRSLEEYVLACQQQGVSMDGWRQQTVCGISCPANSNYSSCTSACPASCNDLTSPSECESPCLEGCECLPGYVLSGFDCVPYKECGCTYLNKYYEIGEIFTTDDCSQTCQCTESSTVFCSDKVCGSDEICGISNYTRGCYRSGPCMPNPCQNDGVCSETTNGTSLLFYCECSELYTGATCEAEKIAEDPDTEDPKDYTYAIVIGVVAGVVVIVILISSTVYLYRRKKNVDTHTITRDSSLKWSRDELDARVHEQDYGCIVNSAFDQNESQNTQL